MIMNNNLLKSSDNGKFPKNPLTVGRVGKFVGEVLTGPVFVVFAVAPQTRGRHVVDLTPESAPDFVAVGAITQS